MPNNLNQLNNFIEKFAVTLAYESIKEIATESNKLCPMAKDEDHDFAKYPKHLRESMEIKQGNTLIGNGSCSGIPNMKGKGNDKTASISYENDYALYVHEMPDSVNWTTPGTGPHYLENPAQTIDIETIAKNAFKKCGGTL